MQRNLPISADNVIMEGNKGHLGDYIVQNNGVNKLNVNTVSPIVNIQPGGLQQNLTEKLKEQNNILMNTAENKLKVEKTNDILNENILNYDCTIDMNAYFRNSCINPGNNIFFPGQNNNNEVLNVLQTNQITNPKEIAPFNLNQVNNNNINNNNNVVVNNNVIPIDNQNLFGGKALNPMLVANNNNKLNINNVNLKNYSNKTYDNYLTGQDRRLNIPNNKIIGANLTSNQNNYNINQLKNED